MYIMYIMYYHRDAPGVAKPKTTSLHTDLHRLPTFQAQPSGGRPRQAGIWRLICHIGLAFLICRPEVFGHAADPELLVLGPAGLSSGLGFRV